MKQKWKKALCTGVFLTLLLATKKRLCRSMGK